MEPAGQAEYQALETEMAPQDLYCVGAYFTFFFDSYDRKFFKSWKM